MRFLTAEQTMKKLAIFDFDYTLKQLPELKNKEDATFGVKSLFPGGEFSQSIKDKIKEEVGWLALSKFVIQELNKVENVSKTELKESIANNGWLIEGLDKVIKKLAADHEVIVVTHNYTHTVDFFLQKCQLVDSFSKVIGQPTQVNEEAKILFGEIPEELKQCSDCEKHIFCKTAAIQSYKGQKVYENVKYFGDGKNDLCPALSLGSEDQVFPRIGYALNEILPESDVKATVHPWKDGHDILTVI